MDTATKSPDTIESLMTDLGQVEKHIANCEGMEFTKRKYLARRCREAINKIAKISQFIDDFGLINKNDKNEK
jgi:hypothetical protein